MQIHARWMTCGLLAILTALSAGCGGEQEPAPQAAAPAPEGGAADAGESLTPEQLEYQKKLDGLTAFQGDTSTPEKALDQFLRAVQTGNEDAAEQLLSDVTRVEMAARGRKVQPPGSVTARFDLKEVQYVGENKDGARIYCEWTDADPDGNVQKDELVWVMRRETTGWRVAGMVFKPFPDDDRPLVLNFEQPDDMFRKYQMVAEEMQRREEAAAAAVGSNDPPGPPANQARQPNSNGPSFQR